MRHLDSYCVRMGSLNVGTVTGRGRELGGYVGNEKGWSVMGVRNLKEGEHSEIVEGGCKLIRSGANEHEWSGVGIVLSKELKEHLISVSRKSGDPVVSVEQGLEEMVVNIMCT